MSQEPWGLIVLVGWVAWSVTGAVALRLALAAAGRRYFSLDAIQASAVAWLGIVVVFVTSLWLHLAILGSPNMYGATPKEAFSLQAYLLAPFGLPLAVGGYLVLFGDMFVMLLFNKKTGRK